MVDRKLLLEKTKGKMRETAEKMQISYVSLYRKAYGYNEFNETEIDNLIALFGSEIFVAK